MLTSVKGTGGLLYFVLTHFFAFFGCIQFLFGSYALSLYSALIQASVSYPTCSSVHRLTQKPALEDASQ